VEPSVRIPLTAAMAVVVITGCALSRAAWSGFAIETVGLITWIPTITMRGLARPVPSRKR
jgi:hypothetical protein